MAANNKLEPVARNTFNCASLTGSYAVVSLGGFSVDLAIYKLYNGGSNDIDVSYNGVVDHDIIPAGGTLVLDVQANKKAIELLGPQGVRCSLKEQLVQARFTKSATA